MKRTGVIIISLIILMTVAWTVNIVYTTLTGSDLFREIRSLYTQSLTQEPARILNTTTCSDRDKNTELSSSEEKHLVQINKYQELCKSYITSQVMIFTDLPKDSNEAISKAKDMADILIAFSDANITPLVIVEPVTTWGLTDFQEFGNGFYNTWIQDYFKELKAHGITDEQMGTWVPFPEANLPYWNHANATPAEFAKVVNTYLSLMKSEFPEASGSILLNSATYESDDFNWVNGEYVSLHQYVVGLDHDLIDSVGLQGLPWISSATDEPSSVFNPQEFINHALIEEVAVELEAKNIWFNTGTFGAKYTVNKESTSFVTPEKRKDMLNGILSEAIKLENLGFEVTINIFAQDKSASPEATDWSYLNESFSGSLESEQVFIDFAAKATNNNIELSLFDRND